MTIDPHLPDYREVVILLFVCLVDAHDRLHKEDSFWQARPVENAEYISPCIW